MFKKTIYLLLPIAMIISITTCGFRESDITESEAYLTLLDFAEENNLLDPAEQSDTPTNGSAPQDNDNSRIMEFPYMPIEALTNETPGNNNFTGEYYFIHLFPLEYGEAQDGSSGYFVSGYALHVEDEYFSSMAIGGIPTMDDWPDVFDQPSGFLVTFQYVGYSEAYNMAYGIYKSHKITPDGFDGYSQNHSTL